MSLAFSNPFAVSVQTNTAPAWTILPPFQWYMIPNTSLSLNPVLPFIIDNNPTKGGSSVPASIIDAYCGGMFDTKRNRYIAHGGGHVDYHGNGVAALNLNQAVPAWTPIHNNSALSDVVYDTGYYLDGRPTASHTYFDLQYSPTRDRMMRMVTSSGAGNGNWYPNVDGFNFALNEWDPAGTWVPQPATGQPQSMFCRHPVNDIIYSHQAGGRYLYAFSPVNNTFTRMADVNTLEQGATACVDPLRNRIFRMFGDKVVSSYYDLNQNGVKVRYFFTGPAAADLATLTQGAVIYEPVIDKYLYWSKSALYRIDPDSFSVDIVPLTGAVPPYLLGQLNARFHYIPAFRGCILICKYANDAYFMRTN